MTDTKKKREEPQWLPDDTVAVIWTDKDGNQRVEIKPNKVGPLRPPEERDLRGLKPPRRK